MQRIILLFILIFSISCSWFKKDYLTPKNPELRPWQSNAEKKKFMIKMVTKLFTEESDHCIDLLHQQLADAKIEEAIPRQSESAGRSCGESLRSCGNCHLPKKNNCNYVIELTNGHKFQAGIEDMSSKDITFIRNENENSPVADSSKSNKILVKISELKKTEWLNGADPLHTWWDFKRFNKKAEIARKMFAIAAENKVGCTNCHMRHGDFRLTEEGKIFKQSGTVIHKVPLENF